MPTKTINISLPAELLAKIDAEAKSEYASRSDYIRDTLVRRIKGQRIVDAWGDEGSWTTVADFREINPQGAPADELVVAIDKLLS